ncbi:M20/M25/M40 family metallo-hydrolase [Halioglobus maricola]|uniref:M20/M25/M40 family metallo-hydrolase n=1 Tax=Halioglobus maricola TaxID=2601894 RepID=UPI00147876B3|nr:M20/M25/M40 family metallo-hydrolase [Halioglobus maricola]
MLRSFILLATLASFSVVAHANPEERLAQAVQIPTISHQDPELVDREAFDAFKQFLESTYPRVFSELVAEWVNEYSLLLVWPGVGSGAILFTAHHDVVPIEPGTEQDWTHPPFAGVIADGRVYGRGTVDDKLGVISLLEAVDRLLQEGYAPRKTIVLAFGHDEEVSGRNGAAALSARMQALGLEFDWMVDEGGYLLTGNPMLPDNTMAMINIAEKGYTTLTLTAKGEGGHSSSPPAVSTIGRLARALDKLEQNPFPPRLSGPVKEMLVALAPHMGQPEQLMFSNLWLTDKMIAGRMAEDRLTAPMVRTTTALTMFNAGIKENVVPQRAEAKVNFRLLPGDTVDSVIRYVRDVIDDDQIDIASSPWSGMPGTANTEGAGYQAITRAVADVYPEAIPVPSLLMATTDTRHYIELAKDQYRFHGAVIDYTQASGIHGTDEWVGVESFRKSIDVATGMMRYGSE